MQQQSGYDRRQYFANSATTPVTYSQSRHRNLSGPSSTSSRPALDNRTLATPPPGVPGAKDSAPRDGHGSTSPRGDSAHRKLDRSLSDSEDRINGNGRGVNSARYKTELCRPFEESGHCKYGDKCQFAHGAHELRNLTRHPKYKTERCRTYHTIGFCPYGPRCHFIHNEDERIVSHKNSNSRLAQQQQQQQQQRSLLSNSSVIVQRPNNLCGLNSIGSSFESVSTTSSSPGNLSPTLNEDLFPSITTFSPVCTSDPNPVTVSQDSSTASLRSSPSFNIPASDAAGVGSILTPLQIQTQQFYNNVVDMAALRFSAVLNISQNQRNNVDSFCANINVNMSSAQGTRQTQQQQPPTAGMESESAAEKFWPTSDVVVSDLGLAFPPPSTSPVSSNSDDSMGSTGSLESSANSVLLDNAASQLVNSPLELGRCMRLPIFNQLST